MRFVTFDEVKQLSIGEAKAIISQNIYEASTILEKLESAGKIMGNGHHARQLLGAMAEKEIETRWITQ